MKQMILITSLLFLLIGCNIKDTPSSLVEELLNKYQMLDDSIKNQIDEIVEDDILTLEQQQRYRKILYHQYRNLTYEVKEEAIDKNNATVKVMIDVLNYRKSLDNIYASLGNDYTIKEYNNKKLDLLEQEKNHINYLLEFDLIKNSKGEWKLLALSNVQLKKLQGMY